jgi:hypothetical protein
MAAQIAIGETADTFREPACGNSAFSIFRRRVLEKDEPTDWPIRPMHWPLQGRATCSILWHFRIRCASACDQALGITIVAVSAFLIAESMPAFQAF